MQKLQVKKFVSLFLIILGLSCILISNVNYTYAMAMAQIGGLDSETVKVILLFASSVNSYVLSISSLLLGGGLFLYINQKFKELKN